MSREIKVYDTTLRDGTQGEGVSFSMEDKVRIAHRLDALGIHYIEGGWPGSNPKDLRFFKRVQDAVFKTAKITAFGSTRRPGVRPQEDSNIQALVEAGPPVVTIFGKSWDLHVTHALGTTLEENVAMIGDSVAYLLKHFEEVIYDAEHFFDGFKKNREYALETLRAAEAAGAHCLVLCDTNGGGLPHEVVEIIREVKKHVKPETPLGIHVHNDTECAVANTLAAVSEGVGHVQGTVNGYGERCGNANLVSIIPNLMLKMGLDCIPTENLRELRDVSRFVSELANRKPWGSQPYVGRCGARSRTRCAAALPSGGNCGLTISTRGMVYLTASTYREYGACSSRSWASAASSEDLDSIRSIRRKPARRRRWASVSKS